MVELKFKNSLVVNPFYEVEDEDTFWQVSETKSRAKSSNDIRKTSVWADYVIDDQKKVLKRTREDIWKVIGEAGAIHDGLYLIAGLLLKPLASNYFLREFV